MHHVEFVEHQNVGVTSFEVNLHECNDVATPDAYRLLKEFAGPFVPRTCFKKVTLGGASFESIDKNITVVVHSAPFVTAHSIETQVCDRCGCRPIYLVNCIVDVHMLKCWACTL